MKHMSRLATLGLSAALSLFSYQAHSALLPLGDDNFEEVALDFAFPFFGSTYNSVFVGSNGYLTFGSGDTDLSESVPDFLNDQPRIAGWWDDLAPHVAGAVDATGDANSMVVSWIGVPQFFGTDDNTFSISLFATGAVEISFVSLGSRDGLVGISAGGGVADPGPTDFSAIAGPFDVSQTRYEAFSLPNNVPEIDLIGSTLRFEPQNVPVPGTLALLALAMFGLRRVIAS